MRSRRGVRDWHGSAVSVGAHLERDESRRVADAMRAGLLRIVSATVKKKMKADMKKKTKEKTIEKRERLARKKKFGFRKMFMVAQTVRAGQISAEHHASYARRPARAQL